MSHNRLAPSGVACSQLRVGRNLIRRQAPPAAAPPWRALTRPSNLPCGCPKWCSQPLTCCSAAGASSPRSAGDAEADVPDPHHQPSVGCCPGPCRRARHPHTGTSTVGERNCRAVHRDPAPRMLDHLLISGTPHLNVILWTGSGTGDVGGGGRSRSLGLRPPAGGTPPRSGLTCGCPKLCAQPVTCSFVIGRWPA